ncbi:tetratricopeptide repeat protein [Actimicrobium sp. GrIS 1.19]|uniref:tetratricopeptide repeat protein n=1 Tax=Actimicrobium sp. GrIS 1.19 TaxID=3071708 RepID=UPI002E14AE7E
MNTSLAELPVRSGNAATGAAATDLVAAFQAMPLIEPGLDCEDAQAQAELGMALQQTGNLAGAVTAYSRAIALQPEWPEMHVMLGLALQQLGQRDDAIGALRRAVALRSDDAQIWSNLGVLLQECGRSSDAIEALQHAIRLKPRMTEAHANLGVILRLLGRPEEAIESLRHALALQPNYAEAHANLGACFNQLGRLDDAAGALRVATVLRPGYAEAHADLGRVMMALGRPADAAAACRTAISLGMETSDNYLSMGVALQDLGQQDEAVAAYQRALDLEPDCADACSNLGVVLLEQGAHDKAIAAFRQATALNPAHPHAFANLSIALHERGDDEQAAQCFAQAVLRSPEDADVYSNFAMVRIHQQRFEEALALLGKAAELNQNHGRPLAGAVAMPVYRLKHDREQMALLRQRGLLAPGFAAYAAALDALPAAGVHAGALSLDASTAAGIAPSYNRLVHIPAPVAISGPCLNPQLDVAQLERAYLESRPEVVWVDDFLSPAALEAIRNFCLEATVWKKEYPNGYLGATLKDGFASPLILQIAEELRIAFPAIFDRNLLEQAWAFKYDSTMKGINVHADFAAVNVNFWITREQACLDPERGGLVIWDAEAPRDWSFQKYNGDEAQIRRFLSASGARSIRVPYRENRCVIFNSTLFHETDRFAFNDAYEDRRINVTLLYGKGLKMR